MTIELVVLDLAGTTVHDGDAVNSCFRAALAGAGLNVAPAVVNAVMGLPKPEAIRRLITESGQADRVRRNVDAIHDDFVGRMKDYYAHDSAVREIPGAGEVFATLRRAGIKVALNSGFNRPIVEVLLARLGWTSAVDATVTSDEVPRGRPHPDMIQHLMKQVGVKEASRVAKVGDTQADLEEGASAGCGLNIGVTTGASTRVQLQAWPHTHILDSVAQLPALLAQ